MRVISLVPSLTETLFALGAGDSVVGITDFCIFPEGLTLPRVGGTKTPKIDVIKALRPDLVHMNFEENLERHAREIETFAPVVVTEPKSVKDVANLFDLLGRIHKCEENASRLAAGLREEQASMPPAAFTFACAIWKKPWMWCGGDTYVSDLVATAGGTNVCNPETRYPSLTIEEIASRNPDVIFLPDEPYAFTEADAEEIRSMTGRRVKGPFPGHLFTWHGVRTILGLRYLRTIVKSPESPPPTSASSPPPPRSAS